MERRNLLVGLMALVISSFLLTGTALAHKTSAAKGSQAVDPPACVVHSLSAFTASGEFGEASSVADIVEVECESVYAEHFVKISSQELYNRCDDHLSWISDTLGAATIDGPAIGKVQLDDDGNATVAIWGGPSCASGESLVSAHLEEAPYTTVTTAFTVVAPKVTTPGVTTLVPNWSSSQVENDTDSTVATIVQVEFPAVYAEKNVVISAEQLYDSCQLWPHLVWWGPTKKLVGYHAETVKVKLDDDGNAFVVLVGAFSCAAGPSEIEASLEIAPYKTYTTTFTVLPPEETF
jgi:hypothetical protein